MIAGAVLVQGSVLRGVLSVRGKARRARSKFNNRLQIFYRIFTDFFYSNGLHESVVRAGSAISLFRIQGRAGGLLFCSQSFSIGSCRVTVGVGDGVAQSRWVSGADESPDLEGSLILPITTVYRLPIYRLP